VLIDLLCATGALLLPLLAATVAARRRRAPELCPPGNGVSAAVLVPARDEEDNLGPCVEGLLAQTAAPPVIVIDDGSRDRTREVALAAGRGSPRLTVIDAGPLPLGWGGKVHALARGWAELEARGLATGWVLCTDADTRHAPATLARAAATAERHGLDAISLAALQDAHGPGENLLGPPVFALLDAVLGSWEDAGRGSGPAVANGQYLLVRCRALRALGGFEAIRGQALDDVALVEVLRREGFRTGFFRAPQGVTTRMYRGLGATFRGWRRNLGLIFGRAPGLALGALPVLLGPPGLAVAALVTGRWVAAALLWLGGVAASAQLRASAGNRGRWGLSYPLDALGLAVVLVAGLRDFRRGFAAPWKGRRVEIPRA
jgi:hypothetical protein